MMRTFVPKGASIEQFYDEDILSAADGLNGLPRRKLGYATPEELFEAFLDTVYAASLTDRARGSIRDSSKVNGKPPVISCARGKYINIRNCGYPFCSA